eukprot:1866384-Karenia_brevis.AAC.1
MCIRDRLYMGCIILCASRPVWPSISHGIGGRLLTRSSLSLRNLADLVIMHSELWPTGIIMFFLEMQTFCHLHPTGWIQRVSVA